MAIFAPASLETFFNQPFPVANRATTHEWELADDLGDSHPRSLRQGGALPANSKVSRMAGKIFAAAGKPVTYKLFSSFNRDLTLLLTDACGNVLDSVRGIGNLTKVFTPATSNWYLVKARNSLDTNREQRVWVQVTYTAPDSVDALSSRSRLLPFVDLGADRYGCIGTPLTLNAFFDTGLSYKWVNQQGTQVGTNGTLSVTEPGTYSVTLTNPQTGCTAADAITIFSFEAPPASAIVVRIGDTLKLTNPVPGNRYQWRINGQSNSADTLLYLVIPDNTVSVNLTTRNIFGCQTVTPNLITSVPQLIQSNSGISFFPNPATELVRFQFSEPFHSITIQDVNGKSWLSKTGKGEAEGVLDLSSVPAGLYVVMVKTNKGQLLTSKILVEN